MFYSQKGMKCYKNPTNWSDVTDDQCFFSIDILFRKPKF